MNNQSLISSLDRFAGILPAVVNGISVEDARWRPEDGAWSILEIVTHMADEEVEDFPARLKRTLADPSQKWSPIDPEGWAVERGYNDGDLAEQVQRFVLLRGESINWLRGLSDPDWANTFVHPKGEISAGDLLASWAAHDALHLRQIAKRMYQMTRRDGDEYSTAYAGSWNA
jgi:hypothetical protein